MTARAEAEYGGRVLVLVTLPHFMKAIVAPALVFALASASCRQTTVHGDDQQYEYLLSAYAFGSDMNGAPSCEVAALLPAHQSIYGQWNDTVSVNVARWRQGVGGSRIDTTVTQMIVEVNAGPADSLRVTIRGAFHLDLRGRATNPDEGSGSWTCDDGVPLSGRLSGNQQGVWFLFPNRQYQID